MSVIREWAHAWRGQIPTGAIVDLERRLGLAAQFVTRVEGDDSPPGSESRQQSLIRLEASEKDIYLGRNNVGALQDKRGIPVRYGLANESKAMNERIKSGDLIGIEKVLIMPWHVGTVIGRFLSVECKEEGWKFNPNDSHTMAQHNWQQHVISYGGRAIFATGPGML